MCERTTTDSDYVSCRHNKLDRDITKCPVGVERLEHLYTFVCGSCDHAQIEQHLATVRGVRSSRDMQELTQRMEADFAARQAVAHQAQMRWRVARRDDATRERRVQQQEYARISRPPAGPKKRR